MDFPTAVSRALHAAVLASLLAAAASTGARDTTYADVAPILAQRCVVCHAGPAAPRGLRLDSLDALLAGSERGPVVKAGDPGGSELMRRITGTNEPRMPMTGPPWLSSAEIALFERWIAGGMPPGADGGHTPVPARTPGEHVTWADVAPIFATRCAKCHTDNGLMGPPPEGLRLTSHAEALSSVERARIVPGEPQASELVRRIRGDARPRMPFDGPPWLTEDEQALIADWIAQGARDAEGRAVQRPVGARVRLRGTLGDGWRLDGLALSVGAATRVDKSPRPGDRVEVRGRVAPEQGVTAERIRRR